MNPEQPRLAAARRGFSLSYKGKSLLSSIDPISQTERVAASARILPKTLYLCPSPLLGYGLATLLERITADSYILCLEADEALMALSLEAIPQDILERDRIHLVRSGSPAAVCSYVRENIGIREFRRIERLNLNGGWSLSQGLYDSIEEALRSDMAVNWSNTMTLVKLGRCYARNAIRNLGLLPQALSLDDIHFAADPVLVVGAGPSLDSVLDAMARAAPGQDGRLPFRVVAVDTALGALIARNLHIDLVVALEAQHWNLRDFIGARNRFIPVAMDLSALPATAGATAGNHLLFCSRWAPLRLFSRLEAAGLLPIEIPPLGSVGLAATALALRLTRGPVFVTGLDFSYELDAYHARSTPSRVDQLRRSTRLQSLIRPEAAFREGITSVPGKSGTTPRTDPVLRGYRDLFEREFGAYSRQNTAENRLFDLSPTGLPLGIPSITVQKALKIATPKAPAWPAEGPQGIAAPPSSGGESAGGPEAQGEQSHEPAERQKMPLSFVEGELNDLRLLRDVLSGKREVELSVIEDIVDRADYLWAHFPECAGSDGNRPSTANTSFLKRLRVELDPFIKALEISRETILRP